MAVITGGGGGDVVTGGGGSPAAAGLVPAVAVLGTSLTAAVFIHRQRRRGRISPGDVQPQSHREKHHRTGRVAPMQPPQLLLQSAQRPDDVIIPIP